MKLKIYLLDTFTETTFKGNPTAVCLCKKHPKIEQMQAIARELNLPVTAFVDIRNTDSYAIRYFTVTEEIPACGHATLAAAKVLMDQNGQSSLQIRSPQGIGIETVANADVISMGYPFYQMQPFDVAPATLASLGIQHFTFAGFCPELETLFLELDASTLRSLQPDYQMLIDSSSLIKEVVVTSHADQAAFDFLLRSFCPWIGINEDPVTGSVHAALAPHWAKKLMKSELVAYQASERGGEVYLKVENSQVWIGGKAVAILKGELEV